MKRDPFRTEEEILKVVHGFRDRTLPKEKWTHEAHLVTALWFHVNYSSLEAICYLRSGIIAYNEATGGKNTHTDGYHETVTLFWCKIIRRFVDEHRGLSLLDLCREFLSGEYATRDYLLRFYSRERLFSLEARAKWIEPDLTSIL